MKHLQTITLSLLLIATSSITAFVKMQPVKTSIEDIEQIKNDVWVPFMESYRDLDISKFKSVHDENVVRVTIDRNYIEVGEEYFSNVQKFIEFVSTNKKVIDISFAVLSTAVKDDTAYQTGYYRLRSKDNKGEFVVRNYGFFNVMLKKDDEKWRIALDSDKATNIETSTFNEVDIVYSLH